jgi:hypothetical protein
MISQFLFLGVEDIRVLYPPIQDKKKNHAHFPGKNIFIALRHGSYFIIANKTTKLRFDDLAPFMVFGSYSHPLYRVNMCFLLVNNIVQGRIRKLKICVNSRPKSVFKD